MSKGVEEVECVDNMNTQQQQQRHDVVGMLECEKNSINDISSDWLRPKWFDYSTGVFVADPDSQ